ncbi:MAG: hypothetical protein R3285_06365 [Kiloniellales bacterium]|nr:hypothetical protein [Kiloniellales bacterium]
MKKFLTIALPLVLPFLLYWLYLAIARRRASVAGGAPPPRWQEAPWIWIAAAGVALMAASIAVFGVTSGVEPGVRLQPPTLIDGEIVPGGPAEPVDE